MRDVIAMPVKPAIKPRGVPLERDIFEARVAAARRVRRKRLVLRLGLGALRNCLRAVRHRRAGLAPGFAMQDKPAS